MSAHALTQRASARRSITHRLKPRVAGRTTRRYRANLFQAYVLGAALAFAWLTVLARRQPYFALDLKIGQAVQRFDAHWSHALMHLVSLPGYPPQVYALVLLLNCWLYRVGLKWEALTATLSIVGMGVVGLAVKMFVNRPRPLPHLVRVRTSLDGGTLSFPAGHVQTYISFVGFLGFLSYSLIKASWQRTLTLLTSFGLIGLIGPSRIHAGEHWPSDVLGAYFLGSIWLWLTIEFYRWGKRRFFTEQPLAPESS